MNCLLAISSVARGRGARDPPHWPEEYAKKLFLALLRPILALKTEIAPPMVLEMRIGQKPDVYRPEKLAFS